MKPIEQITREEMIEMARETRKQVTNAVVTPEQLDSLPATVQLREIPTRMGNCQVYDCYGELRPDMPLVINIHGGGFIRGRVPSDELFCRKLVHALDCRVLDIDYRLAPEFPFPTALHECYDVVRWAFAQHAALSVHPQRVILIGHSAGGNLVAGICMMARESGEFQPLCTVMDYPPMDLYTDPGQKPSRGKGIPAERAKLYNLYYCEREQQANPLVSPVFAAEEQLAGFPPSLMITGGQDSLCAEGEQFALLLAQAGNEITLKRFPRAGHGFTIYEMEGHEEAVRLIVRFAAKWLAEQAAG